MNPRKALAAVFALLALAAAFLAVSLHRADGSPTWFLAVAAVFFLVLTWAAARPAAPAEPASTGFAPSVFTETALLLLTILIAFAFAAYLYRRLRGHG